MPAQSTPAGGPSTILPATLSHFVILNPTVRLQSAPSSDPNASPSHHPSESEGEAKEKDEQDDLREAAQILFYTSREKGGVSRDKMLRQVGLVKGLMGFTDLLSAEDGRRYYSIHAQRTRLIVFTPEPDFYFYICVNLAHASSDGKREPTLSSQGLSDQILLDALARGYEDFRLLHGPLSSHLPPTPALSTLLDKYFTRFALTLESTHLTQPTSLSSWIGGYTERSIPEDIINPLKAGCTDPILVVNKDGPLHSDLGIADQPLLRHLVQLVQASLPPPPAEPMTKDPRSTLGFGLLGLGRRKEESQSRKSSWATVGGWIPEIRRGSTPSVNVGAAAESHERVEKGTKWFGLGGIGDAVGSVGTVFGLGGSVMAPTPSPDARNDLPISTAATSGSTAPAEPSRPSIESEHHVEQSAISLPDLDDAVEPDTELEWESKVVWVRTEAEGEEQEYAQRQLSWIIRNNILLAFLSDPIPIVEGEGHTIPTNLPSTAVTLSFFSEISGHVHPDPLPESGVSKTSSTPTNAYLYRGEESVEEKGELDQACGGSLVDLRGLMRRTPTINEIFAQTPQSRYIVAKRSNDAVQELYMSVGRKDANLTDAEQAVRAFSRGHPDFV